MTLMRNFGAGLGPEEVTKVTVDIVAAGLLRVHPFRLHPLLLVVVRDVVTNPRLIPRYFLRL